MKIVLLMLFAYQVFLVNAGKEPECDNGCLIKGSGECIKKGEKFTKDCITYKCICKKNGVRELKVLKKKCPDGKGKCVKLNKIKKCDCVFYQCLEKSPNKLSYEPIERGCKVNGRCYRTGQKVKSKNKLPCFCNESGKVVCAVE